MFEHLCMGRGDACEPLAAAVVPRANGNDKWIYKRLQYKAASAREIYSRGSAGTTTTKFSVFLFKKFSRAKRGLVNRIRKKTMRRLDLTQLRPSVKSTARFNTSPCDGGPNLSFIRVDKLLFPPGARVLLHLVVYIYVTCVSTRQ